MKDTYCFIFDIDLILLYIIIRNCKKTFSMHLLYRKNGRQRIGFQADKINFQQTNFHSMTKLETITFTLHESGTTLPCRKHHYACVQKPKDKTGTTPGRGQLLPYEVDYQPVPRLIKLTNSTKTNK